MLVLSEKQIQSIYSMESAIKDMEKALSHYMERKIQNSHRTVMDFPDKKASALYFQISWNRLL
jgi:ornithine cyclodeaminase